MQAAANVSLCYSFVSQSVKITIFSKFHNVNATYTTVLLESLAITIVVYGQLFQIHTLFVIDMFSILPLCHCWWSSTRYPDKSLPGSSELNIGQKFNRTREIFQTYWIVLDGPRYFSIYSPDGFLPILPTPTGAYIAIIVQIKLVIIIIIVILLLFCFHRTIFLHF